MLPAAIQVETIPFGAVIYLRRDFSVSRALTALTAFFAGAALLRGDIGFANERAHVSQFVGGAMFLAGAYFLLLEFFSYVRIQASKTEFRTKLGFFGIGLVRRIPVNASSRLLVVTAPVSRRFLPSQRDMHKLSDRHKKFLIAQTMSDGKPRGAVVLHTGESSLVLAENFPMDRLDEAVAALRPFLPTP